MDWNEDYDEKEGNRRIYLGREEKEKIWFLINRKMKLVRNYN